MVAIKLDINTYVCRNKNLTQAEFVSSENQCTHRGINSKGHRVRHYKLDGEVLPKGEPPDRCDFLLINDTAQSCYYIELKGGAKAQKAIDQIESAIEIFQWSLPGYHVYKRIVLRKGTHGIVNEVLTQWKKRNGGCARFETTHMIDDISE